MIKRNLRVANIFAAAFMFIFGTMICAAQSVPMVGGFRAAAANSADVKSAADFAVKTENARRGAKTAFSLSSIKKAEAQVVAGMNYRLCLEVASKGKKEQATAVVYRNLQNKYSLTSWESGNCASGAATEETENEQSEETWKGRLEAGKTDSAIVYVGAESGDYAAFCFANSSEAGRRILAACKNGEQCEFSGKVDYESACDVPGLEATLSSQGKITAVSKVKSFAKKRGVKKKTVGKR